MEFKTEVWNAAVDAVKARHEAAHQRQYDESFRYEDHPEFDIIDDERLLETSEIIDFLVEELEKLMPDAGDMQSTGGGSDCGPSGNQYVFNIVCAMIGEDGKAHIVTSNNIEFADWDDWDYIFNAMRMQ